MAYKSNYLKNLYGSGEEETPSASTFRSNYFKNGKQNEVKETAPVKVERVEIIPVAKEIGTIAKPIPIADASEERSGLELHKDAFLYGAGKVGTGILGALEGANDFIGSTFYSGVGAVSDLFGMDKLVDFSKKKSASYLENSITDDLNQKLDEKYKPTNAMQIAGTVNETVSGLLPSLAAGNVVGAAGTGLNAAGQATKGANVSKALFGLSAAGGSASEAKGEGATMGQALAYGAAAGLLETTIEGIAGGIPGMGGGKAGEIAAKLTSNPAVAKILDIVGEGGEEALTTFVTPYLKRAMYNEDAQNATAEEIAQSAAMGMIASGILQGGLELPSIIANRGANTGFIPGSGLDGTPSAKEGVPPVQDRTTTQSTPGGVTQTATMPGTDTSGQFGAVEGEKNAPYQEGALETYQKKMEQIKIEESDLRKSAIWHDVDEDTTAQAERLSTVLGRKIMFDPDLEGANGKYDRDTQTIYIDPNSKDPVAQIISHELTHSVEFAEAYNELSALVQTRIARTGGDIEQLVKDKIAQYAAWDKQLDTEGAMQEVVAEYVSQNLLTDEAAIVEMAKNSPTLVQKIVNFFDGLLAKIGVKSSKERAEIRKMRDTYWRALQQAGTGYGVSTDTTMQRMSDAYSEGALSDADFDDAVDVVMEEESTAGKSMLEGDPLSKRQSESGAQYSITPIKGTRGSYGNGVLLDTNVFDGVHPHDWGKVLGKYVYENLAGTDMTIYDTMGNPETVHIAKTNDRVRKDGAKNSHKVIDEMARYRGNNTVALATVHLSELLETSGNETTTDDKSHQWLDENGWRLRTAYAVDRQGKIYQMTLNIADGRNGLTMYKISGVHQIDTKNKELPAAQVPSAKNGGARTTSRSSSDEATGGVVPSTANGRGSHTNGNSKDIVAKGTAIVKGTVPGMIPREQYSFAGTPPVDEGYWNSIMEQGRIPFSESDQPGYTEALLADVDRQSPYAGRGRDVDPSEYMIHNADTVQQASVAEPSVESGNLPTKAANVLKKAENAMLRALGEKMSVPGVAQREYLKPIVQQISEEYLRTGDVSQETADTLFAEAWQQGIVVDSEYYEENKHIKDYLRTTALKVGDDIKADFADWNDWRKRAFGALRLVNDGGLGVDVAYQELNGMAPGLFPDSVTTTSDQLQRMYDVATSIRRVERNLEAEYSGDTLFEEYARSAFDDALAKMRLELRNVKRFALDRAEQLAKEETTDLTLDDVKAMYPKLKDARRKYERAQAKNLLTSEDNAMVSRIQRGDAELETLDPAEYNVEGIRAVYEAKQEYEGYAKQIRKWNQSRKAKLRGTADTFLRTANAWKDKAKGILYSRETMERNIRDIVPDAKLADQVVREYFTPVHNAVADATRTKNEYRDRVRALDLSTKISKADEKAGRVSEAHAVQLLGEAQDSIQMLERSRGRMQERDGKTLKDWKAVVENLWKNNPQLDKAKIEGAVVEFRKIYDELFTQMNEARVRNGYEPVNYRSGYFPHFQPGDGDGVLVQFGKALGIDTSVSALPTNINGMSHTFKPGITWMGNAQERLGFNTVYDAVEGFDKYIEGVADVIHLTDSIQNLRAFASQIRYRTTEQGIRDQVDAIRSNEQLTSQEKEVMIQNLYNDPNTKYVLGNFVVELDEYINLLANKKSRADRNMEQALGRDAYNVVKALESRVAANMVAVNPASWLTNFIPLTQGWSGVTTKHLLQGMQDTLKSVKADDGIVGQSSFLTNRRGSDPLVQTWAQKASETASKPMEYIDNFTAGSLVRARYYQNIERGMSEAAAMEEADGWVAGVMADRSKGATPTLFNRSNPITKLFTQFQLEVNNQLGYVFKDIPRDMKDKGVKALAGALLKFALGAFLFDEIYEYFIGRRPALDPIGILNDTVGDLTGYQLPNLIEGAASVAEGGEFFEKGERTNVGQAAGNLLANVAGELPFTSVLSVAGIDLDQGRIPVSSAMPDISTIGSVFGDSGWSTKKRVKEGLEEAAKPLTYLALPFGGGQLKKVGQGIYATAKGGSYTMDAEGNEKLQYPVYNDDAWETTKSLVGAGLFGKTTLPTGREWIESGFPTLTVKETEAYQNMTDAGISGEDAWEWLQLMKEADGTIGKLTAVGESGATDEAAQELFGVVMGKDMETDAGNPTQYAKMLEAMADGLTAAEYITYRQVTYKVGKKADKLKALRDAGFTAAEAARLYEQLG